MASWFLGFLYSQFLVTPQYPTHDFSGQTVIVTGANTGLGREAARHLVRLNAEKVIITSRDLAKGEAAKKSIEASTGRENVVEVWQLDLCSYQSVKDFAKKAESLKRLDVLLENAGIGVSRFTTAENDEATITVNVISPFLLALLLLPKLQETALKFNVLPRITVVTSDLHFVTSLPERQAENIFEELNVENRAQMDKRYAVSKLLEVLIVRKMATITGHSKKSPIVINCLNPGACRSDFFREEIGVLAGLATQVAMYTVGRSTEVGSRTLVAAAAGGEETNGKYMTDSKISNPSPFVESLEGVKTQDRVWKELSQKLEKIEPGITKNISN